MFVTRRRYDRDVTFWRDKYLEEAERHRKREDAILNRLLAKAGVYPILEDELVTEPDTPSIPPAGLSDVRAQFNQWADEAGISDVERERQWQLNQNQYIEDLG
jgi:hypothetical protein